MIVRATEARRVLAIASDEGQTAVAVAEALPPEGTLIILERDPVRAQLARASLAARGHAHRVSVMIGQATRYLHKIAGPFEVIFQNDEPAEFAIVHDRLVRLLAPAGTLLTNNVARRDKYNEVLNGDTRLNTVLLNIDGGVAFSVRRRS
jgi:caffeoyl-CoA O-methyltransferase